jgi:hypothetical protein
MKTYECVQVRHHKKIAEAIQEYIMKGWHLHTYQVAGEQGAVNHYLLFEKD